MEQEHRNLSKAFEMLAIFPGLRGGARVNCFEVKSPDCLVMIKPGVCLLPINTNFWDLKTRYFIH